MKIVRVLFKELARRNGWKQDIGRMNKPKFKLTQETSLPKRGDSLDNLAGYPKKFELPLMEDISGKYVALTLSTCSARGTHQSNREI